MRKDITRLKGRNKGETEPIKNDQYQCIRVHGGTYPMQLHVEATGVTDRFSLRIAPPQCGGAGVAVGAAQAGTAGCGLL